MSKGREKRKHKGEQLPGGEPPQVDLVMPQPEDEEKKRGAPSKIRFGLAKLLSNLRFSLTLRIALHYAGRLLRSSLLVLLVFTVVYTLAHVPGVHRALDTLGESPPEVGLQYSSLQLAGLPLREAYLLEEALPDGAEGIRQRIGLAFSRLLEGRSRQLLLYTVGPQGPLVAVYPLDEALYIYTALFWALVCCDLYRVGYFLRKRNTLNRKVLKPISDMADAAAALSATNLSDRISLEGTKNELKDLASVINHMLDRIERSYNSQKQFVSDASHELRTPIAVIQGYASMLERWGKTDKAVLDEGITAIAQETTAMKELVERLLFLARHDKKTLWLELEVFDPTEVMSAVFRDAKLLSPAHSFVLHLGEGLTVQGDKGMIKQLMRILVDNAIKYTPSGRSIALAMAREGEHCVLSVTDTGEGISAQEMPRIFDRFYRSDKARQAQSSGHGLGLSIARIIVVAHGGKLSVRSKEGVGTTFAVKLPISREERG